MPSKPTDFEFFNVLSIECQSEPDPALVRDFCEKFESELRSCQLRRRCFANVSLRATTGQLRRGSARWCSFSFFIPTRKRLTSGKWARGARTQMRRNALLPLLPIETEPGEAVKAITQQAHPITIAAELPSALQEAVKFLSNLVAEIRSFRVARMREFGRAAQESVPGTMQEIECIKDQPLKDFMLRVVPKEQQPEEGRRGVKWLPCEEAPFNGRDRTISPLFSPPAHPFFDERELLLRGLGVAAGCQ